MRFLAIPGVALVGVWLWLSTVSSQARILINEIHYDPKPETSWAEFVELYNSGSEAVDLSGWQLARAVAYTVPNGTVIAPGQYLVLAQHPETIFTKWGVSALGPWTGLLKNSGETIRLLNAAGGEEDVVEYRLGFPWPTVGELPSCSIELMHWSFDSSLGGNWRASVTAGGVAGPTPGRRNAAFSINAPPQIRQVDHSPGQPATGQPVRITAKITDPEGVTAVALHYQVVVPGGYIALTDSAYANTWLSLSMNDSGEAGDLLAGDSIYTAVLPGTVQQHRVLVRYRISATDGAGLAVRVPYPDDPQPNFAYFCYDGIPAWQAALQPGVSAVVGFGTNVMRRIPAVHLISRKSDVESATWFNRYGGDGYPWVGTLVYDGKVLDHVHYRARGGVWRYAMVKNMWKIDLTRGHYLQFRDDYGQEFGTEWTKLNLGACIQQADFGHRGEQGMFESVGYRLFNLAGVASPRTAFVQLRIIDEAAESPADQYEGDFWGLYLAIEQEDGRFLDEHGLPDGNFYKMEGGSGELNNLGPAGPSNKADLNYFLSTYRSTTVPPSEAWWRTNLLLDNYWSYQAIVQGIHHYDICYDKNYFYYRNPVTGLWSVHSWDLDLTWANNMFDSGCGGIDDLYRPVFGGGAYPVKPAFTLEYQNRVREILDLLFNTDQAWKVIDEQAALLRDPGSTRTFLDADRFKWDFNPKMTNRAYSSALQKAGTGKFYKWPNEQGVSKDFEGCVQLMKAYVTQRAQVLENAAADSYLPARPAVAYTGPPGFPVNRVSLRASPFAGAYPFSTAKWRLGEITLSDAPAFNPAAPRKYEIEAVWEAESSAQGGEVTLPAAVLKVGHAYRARVKYGDTSGRWSRWSAPLEFVAGAPDNAAALVAWLKLTELMYHPPGGSDDEFIEFRNASASAVLDLGGARFTDGITYSFPAGTLLPPGEYLVLARSTNVNDFRARYGLSAETRVAGGYEGSLNNDGEQLTLKVAAAGEEIAAFHFAKDKGWPVAAQGGGHSLVPLESVTAGQATGALDYPGNWRASTYRGGSPGREDPLPSPPDLLLNEIAAHTDYFDPARPEFDSNDWIELYNPGPADVETSDWYLSDDPADLRKWRLPFLVIPPRGRCAFDEVSGFHNPFGTGFGLNKAGEQVLLSFLPGSAGDRVVDAMGFSGQDNDQSIGRYPDGSGWWYASWPSRGAANRAGLPGLRISEVMYHPPGPAGVDNSLDEYVELWNPTGSRMDLQSAEGTWRLDGGVTFTFPPGTYLEPLEAILVANIDPANASALAAFRTTYGLGGSVRVLGPYQGKLSNRSDRVALEKPLSPDLPGDPYSWVVVDEVIYGNQNPWPTTADGGGHSLQRLSMAHSGNNPANWQPASPNPGTVAAAATDSDGDGMPDDWELLHGLSPVDPGDAHEDRDGDGFDSLAEFQSGTDPGDKSSYLGFDSISSQPGCVLLWFVARDGRSYTVQHREDVDGSEWQALTNIPAAEERPVFYADPLGGDGTRKFYRLVTPALP